MPHTLFPVILTAHVEISDKVFWLSTNLKEKITANYIQKGTLVALKNGVQYLDATKPVTSAVLRAEPTFKEKGRISPFLNAIWFYNQVKSHAPWDIKIFERWEETIGTTFPGSGVSVIFRGNIEKPDTIGNITYGYLGTAMGWNEADLLDGGDYAAGGFIGVFTNADKEDASDIRKGINWYNDTH